MKDKVKSSKETGPKKATQQQGSALSIEPDKLHKRIIALENFAGTLVLDLSEQRKRTESLYGVVQSSSSLVANLYHQLNEALKLVDSNKQIPDNFKWQLDQQSKFIFEWSRRYDETHDELSRQHNLHTMDMDHRIETICGDLNALRSARGLDIDMKKIVDGLEETVHELEKKCEHRYKKIREGAWNHVSMVWDEIVKISDFHKLVKLFIVPSFTMALVAFVLTVTNLIKQIFN